MAGGFFARPRIGSDEVGEQLEVFTLPDGRVVSASFLEGSRTVNVPFSFAEAYDNLVPSVGVPGHVSTSARTQQQPTQPLLPREAVHYSPHSTQCAQGACPPAGTTPGLSGLAP